MALLFGVSQLAAAQATGNTSLTSAVAALATLALGALSTLGQPVTALACAVTMAALLDLRPVLHRWLQHMEGCELRATLQLAVLSTVVLPLLPDAGLGPYEALNPYRLWLAAMLVAGLSLAGHFAMRLAGARAGVLLTGLLGGLASSTAATLALARRSRDTALPPQDLAAGILCTCGVMFARVGVLVGALKPILLVSLGAALAAMVFASFASAAWLWRRGRRPPASSPEAPPALDLRFDLLTAFGFAAFMAIVALLSHAVLDRWREPALYGLALLSGLVDVDVMIVSLSSMPLSVHVATLAMLATMASNMFAKAGIAWVVGGRVLGLRAFA